MEATRKINKIAVGGGCHWCTEAVFQSIKGVFKVEQGFVASDNTHSALSEAVIIHYNPEKVPLDVLLDIHLRTHKSMENHTMRDTYRSAVYFFSRAQEREVIKILNALQLSFEKKIQTLTLPFVRFKPSREEILNYYYSDPNKPFCQRYITPKLAHILKTFNRYVDQSKLEHIF